MKLAFIGMGNMAYAILKGGCDRGFFNPAHVSAYDINTVRLAEVAAETGITAAVSTAEAARQADMVLLAVKPNVVESVVAEMAMPSAARLYCPLLRAGPPKSCVPCCRNRPV